MKKFWNLRQRK